jgi:hypothetical protein
LAIGGVKPAEKLSDIYCYGPLITFVPRVL